MTDWKPNVIIHAYNPSTWEGEAGRLRVQGQFGIPSKILRKQSTNQDRLEKKSSQRQKKMVLKDMRNKQKDMTYGKQITKWQKQSLSNI
jgi:hypothetical protein